MAVRNDFTAGEVLAAADLNDTFAQKLPYSFGTATPSTTDSGFLWYDSNSTPAAPKFWDGSAFQALTSGKILQIVRATDGTQRTTTSATFTDITAASVTITPQKNDSAVILLLTLFGEATNTSGSGSTFSYYQITDNSNNAISGANIGGIGLNANANQFQGTVFMLGYATPATTSAVTYKGRFRSGNVNTTNKIYNDLVPLQMYAIEVSA